jgi:hypothetical protein
MADVVRVPEISNSLINLLSKSVDGEKPVVIHRFGVRLEESERLMEVIGERTDSDDFVYHWLVNTGSNRILLQLIERRGVTVGHKLEDAMYDCSPDDLDAIISWIHKSGTERNEIESDMLVVIDRVYPKFYASEDDTMIPYDGSRPKFEQKMYEHNAFEEKNKQVTGNFKAGDYVTIVNPDSGEKLFHGIIQEIKKEENGERKFNFKVDKNAVCSINISENAPLIFKKEQPPEKKKDFQGRRNMTQERTDDSDHSR